MCILYCVPTIKSARENVIKKVIRKRNTFIVLHLREKSAYNGPTQLRAVLRQRPLRPEKQRRSPQLPRADVRLHFVDLADTGVLVPTRVGLLGEDSNIEKLAC